MLSLLKRKTEAGAVSLIPPWHPDFRNRAVLPDIKVVRTAFFVNGAAIFLAVVLLVYLGAREYELYSLNAQVKFWQTQIDRDRAVSAQAIVLYKKFQEEEKRISEVSTFVKARPSPSEIIQRLGESRPRNIAFDYVELREAGLIIRGTVRGAAELATGEVSSYLDVLKKDSVLTSRFEDPVATSVTRTVSGRLRMEISMKYKGGKK